MKKFFKWTLLVLLIIFAAGEFYFIRVMHKRPVTLGSYSLFDYGDYVNVKGSWRSQDMYEQFQTTSIECNRAQGICVEATSTIHRDVDHLSNKITIWNVKRWDDETITFDPDSSMCCNIDFAIDIKKKLVTKTRSTFNTTGICEGISTKSMVLTLSDGLGLERY